jgi:FHA domain-containing protein
MELPEMGILRRIETRLERTFEGGFGRTFKSNVQPVELARKLAKEMDDNRTISVSQVYVPNIYSIYLSPADRAQFATFEASLRSELAGYLTQHAKRQAYSLPGRIRVVIETADELEIGLFGIAVATEEEPRFPDLPPHSDRAAETPDPPALPPEFLADPGPAVAPVVPAVPVAAEPPAAVPPVPPVPPVVVPSPEASEPEPDEEPAAASETALISAREARAADLAREEYALTWDGGRHVLDRRAVVLGRSRDCDIVLDDRSVSRRHAELVRHGDGFLLRDLDSTNGSAVNGKRIRESPVLPGDDITLGTVALTLEQSRT